MSDYATPTSAVGGDFEEPPQVMARNLRVASQLWASATAFFFFAFVFAYFYLRSLNSQNLWHPHGVSAPTGSGTAIMLLVVVSAAAGYMAARKLAAGDAASFRIGGLVALALGLAAIVVQIVQWSSLGFGPTDGGYASVFVGWTGLYALFLFGTLYWLETLVATSFRSPKNTDSAAAAAFAFYWVVLALVGVATWVVLYLL
ncbi:MAG TPA: cytochrome c oxidase subunit 3 [Gaiellaceae bacterium]|nr:cytochrome c oxidase subunit 3 [Gaiellaceae bacterium]